MNRLDQMTEERINSLNWSREIAKRVIKRKTAKLKNMRILFSAAAALFVVAGAGVFYQTKQTPTLKSSVDYVLSETVSGFNENTVISGEMDKNIIQYCMSIK